MRLLSYALDENPSSRHPFVLALELLEEGSLADHLRGPAGEAPKLPPLTPLERIDAALGAAAGLAYLHGLREEGEPGAPAPPVLHRDVKSANIGLTRLSGALYAKVMDCGLARALKGSGAAAPAAGATLTGGVVGTLGYMAPELATGAYSPRSDIYAFGCVLLELLSGARVGPDTATALEERAIEDGEGVGALTALAEPCWPPPAAAALAALALACIHARPKRRPAAMAEVLGALRAARALLAPPAAPPAPLVPCPLQCGEEVPEASGLRCPGGGHFACHGCLQGYVRTNLEVAVLRRNAGRIPCYHAGQGCAHAWAVKDLQEALDKGTLVAFGEALVRMFIDGPREAAALAAAQAAAVEAAARLALRERVAALRRVIVERDLLLRCPHCAAEFDDYDGCNALTCGRCGAGFCAVCLADCGSAREAHVHYRAAHGEDYYDRPLFERERRARYLARVVAAVRDAGEPEVQRALVAELAVADLRDLGISEAEVLAGAGVAAQGGVEGADSLAIQRSPAHKRATLAGQHHRGQEQVADEEEEDEEESHELVSLAGQDFRSLPLLMTEEEAVARMRHLVAQDPALAEPAEPGQPSLVSEAFLVACANCNVKVASHLLQMGADVNVCNPEVRAQPPAALRRPSSPPSSATPHLAPLFLQNNWTPLIATMYEPSFNSSAALVRLLLNARAKVDVWAVDHLHGWCALDYAREYEALVRRLGAQGFSGEDIADYRAYAGELEVRGGGAAPLPPEEWLRDNPLNAPDVRTPASECLSLVRGCISLLAKHLGCPVSVFVRAAPGECRRAYEAHVAAVGGAAGAGGGGGGGGAH